MQQLITSAVLSLLVLILCVLRPNAGRIFLGLFLLVMPIGVNVVLVFVAPDQFVALGTNDAIVPRYRWFFENVAALAPPLFGLLAAAYEVAIALLMLSKVRKVGTQRGHSLPHRDHSVGRMDACQSTPGVGYGLQHKGARLGRMLTRAISFTPSSGGRAPLGIVGSTRPEAWGTASSLRTRSRKQ